MSEHTDRYTFSRVSGPEGYRIARELFREYASTLDFDLCFQDFEGELAGIEVMYAPSGGGIILMKEEVTGTFPGCAAIRRIDTGTAELKRMYIRDTCRGRGLGRRLLDEAIDLARGLNYRVIRLDTMPTMSAAIALYKSAGFREIPPYRFNPDQGAVFMEKHL
ncbi:MAG TPA: GNAT family N-acetyltransferase [Bacteroidales bacterium]|nr:GNAT family N-acetyltransferase [Bacteroidales bacterium]HPS62616.1 GNAT family N-acetyltransferase [Bacteroidales bacterium]